MFGEVEGIIYNTTWWGVEGIVLFFLEKQFIAAQFLADSG